MDHTLTNQKYKVSGFTTTQKPEFSLFFSTSVTDDLISVAGTSGNLDEPEVKPVVGSDMVFGIEEWPTVDPAVRVGIFNFKKAPTGPVFSINCCTRGQSLDSAQPTFSWMWALATLVYLEKAASISFW